MNRLFLVAIASVLLVGPVTAESVTLDQEKSKIEFVGKKADGKHDGGFKKFTSEAVYNADKPAASSLVIAIDATSLWADHPKLTNHLKNPDFFDVRKYPKIEFKSSEVVVGEEGKCRIIGQMTMLGKPVKIEIPATAETTDSAITLDADFVIDRTKWGMDYGQGKVNNEVDIKAHLVFNR